MVLVEQTWVFWLEDNLEDLELGARSRCCEKTEVLLDRVGWLHLGLVLYWRYMLLAQIQRSLEAVEAVPGWRRGGREVRGQEILGMWMMLCQRLLDWRLW